MNQLFTFLQMPSPSGLELEGSESLTTGIRDRVEQVKKHQCSPSLGVYELFSFSVQKGVGVPTPGVEPGPPG